MEKREKTMNLIDKYLNERKQVKTKSVCKDCGGNARYSKKEDKTVCIKCGSSNIKNIKIK